MADAGLKPLSRLGERVRGVGRGHRDALLYVARLARPRPAHPRVAGWSFGGLPGRPLDPLRTRRAQIPKDLFANKVEHIA